MRLLGQILLWAGFISAALAATSQREFDFLPESERAALEQLPTKLRLNVEELKSITNKDLNELNADEFERVVAAVIPISEANLKAEEETAAAKLATESSIESNNASVSDASQEETPEPPSAVSYSEFEKSRTTRLNNKWSTVPWLWYGLSALVGIVGVFLLRSTAKSAEQEHGKVTAEFETVNQSLEKLIKGVNQLHVTLDKKSPREIVHYIDDELAETFNDFAESRNSLVQKFGLQAYAEIMTQFASAERFVNRSWSAAADGYIHEVRSCVERAAAHLEQANALMTEFKAEFE